jgi:osomolarity two-component system phosphorelay intermediate protein YPD1
MSAALRARSPNIMDDIVKRPPPSPSDKAPPQKKLDVKPRPASEEPTPKAGSPVIAPKEKNDLKEAEKKDEVCRQLKLLLVCIRWMQSVRSALPHPVGLVMITVR